MGSQEQEAKGRGGKKRRRWRDVTCKREEVVMKRLRREKVKDDEREN